MQTLSQSFRTLLALLTLTASCGTFCWATELEPTHKQIRMFQPKQGESPTRLNTFCLDSDGNILACTTGNKNLISVYSPELSLAREIVLPFSATAINVSPNGTIYAGGNGKIVVVSPSGEILSEHPSPQFGDDATFKERLEKMAAERLKKTLEGYAKQIVRLDGQIGKLKEQEELSERDQKRLDTYTRQKDIIQSNMKQFEENSQVDTASLIANATIRSIAVTSKNVFVCCTSMDGKGYEVWKANLDMSEPIQLVSSLTGCCGQFDIQANEDYLILAENTKFQVGLRDHTGKQVSSFGKSTRMGGDGFGSCCNPMNVRCCDNGDILTAESSIGTIKRFNQAGELVGIVGKAKIGGGCKHVALGFDKARNRYYIQYEDKNGICILVPSSEVTELTIEEIAAKKAREGLGSKLVGDWSINGKARSENAVSSVFALIGGVSDPFLANVMKFSADGGLTGTTPGLKWEAITADDKILMINMDMEGVGYELKVEFVDDDQIVISSIIGEQEFSKKKYKRITDTTPPTKPTDTNE